MSQRFTKIRKWIPRLFCVLLIGVVASVILAWQMRITYRTSYGYKLVCVKCLYSKNHVEENKYIGGISTRQVADLEHVEDSHTADYARIFGHPCQHVFRKGVGVGISRYIPFERPSEGDGHTPEGSFFRWRYRAVEATFDAEHRISNLPLVLETFRLIDSLLPPDAEFKRYKDYAPKVHQTLAALSEYLPRVRNVDQWRNVLECAKNDFRDTPKLDSE